VLDGAQVLQRVALLLQRIVGRAIPLDLQLGRLELDRLLGVGRGDKRAAHDDGAADVERRGARIAGRGGVIDDLEVADDRAVVELDERAGLDVPGGANPAAQLGLFADIVLRLAEDLFYRIN